MISKLSYLFGLFLPLIISLQSAATPTRIISLAPHTTELVYALGKGNSLVAVSDFSDFPAQASQLPSVASYQGVDFEQIMRLKPDLILAWQGGNKPQDLSRLANLGFSIFYSSPKNLDDIGKEIRLLGNALNTSLRARQLASDYEQRLSVIRNRFARAHQTRVFYYMWTKPLMTIGKNAWANQLLGVCSATSVFGDAGADYPQVTIEKIIRKKPEILIAAMHTDAAKAQQFWQPYSALLNAPLIVVDPDKLHRFTPRLLDELEKMCLQLSPKS